MIYWVVSTSWDIKEIRHLIKKLTDGNEFHDTVFPAHCWAWSKVARLFTGRLWEQDAAAGPGCFPLFPTLGLQTSHGSGSASQLGFLASCLRVLQGAPAGSRRTVSGVRCMYSFHSHLLCTFYVLPRFSLVRIYWATTLFSKASVSPVNKTWAQPCPNIESYSPKSPQNWVIESRHNPTLHLLLSGPLTFQHFIHGYPDGIQPGAASEFSRNPVYQWWSWENIEA